MRLERESPPDAADGNLALAVGLAMERILSLD